MYISFENIYKRITTKHNIAILNKNFILLLYTIKKQSKKFKIPDAIQYKSFCLIFNI